MDGQRGAPGMLDAESVTRILAEALARTVVSQSQVLRFPKPSEWPQVPCGEGSGLRTQSHPQRIS